MLDGDAEAAGEEPGWERQATGPVGVSCGLTLFKYVAMAAAAYASVQFAVMEGASSSAMHARRKRAYMVPMHIRPPPHLVRVIREVR